MAVLIHELGHYVVSKRLGYKIENFSLSPYGVSIDIEGQKIENKDEILISLAGPVFNLITIFFVTAIWWIFPIVFNFTYEFVNLNMIILLFNLLPLYPMDGGRVFVSIFSNFVKRKIALKFSIILNLITSIIFFILFIITCFISFNPTLILFPIFLILGCIDIGKECRYEKIDVFCKKFKNFSKANIYIVSSHTKLKDIISFQENNKNMLFMVQFDNGNLKLLNNKKLMYLALHNDYESEIELMFKK
ncbi:MAG: hypothetical protein IJ008_03900 [Clostridia bacterium]|nr:hypothetical protein [Clostridia bacterium]